MAKAKAKSKQLVKANFYLDEAGVGTYERNWQPVAEVVHGVELDLVIPDCELGRWKHPPHGQCEPLYALGNGMLLGFACVAEDCEYVITGPTVELIEAYKREGSMLQDVIRRTPAELDLRGKLVGAVLTGVRPSFVCPRPECGHISYHREDIRDKHCGGDGCGWYFSDEEILAYQQEAEELKRREYEEYRERISKIIVR